jgi:hypothetical protein
MTTFFDDRNFSNVGRVPDRRRETELRRKDIRMASKPTPATLCVAARLPIKVQIIDVSRNGLGIITPSSVLVGSSVVLVCGALTINGTVRHCKERLDGEYSAGISISRIVETSAGKEL